MDFSFLVACEQGDGELACGRNLFLSGKAPHYCDFGLFHHLDLAHFLDDDLLNDFPQLAAFMQNMCGINGMADYLQSRPELTGVGVKPQLVIDGRPVSTGMRAD